MFTHKVTTGKNYDAMSIRLSVFVDEQGFTERFDDIDEIAHSIVIYKGETPVATGRVFPTDDKNVWKIGRLAVLKDFRQHKLGSKVMKLVEKTAIENNVSTLELSAQLHAKGFYEKLGYTAISEVYLVENIEHVLMKKNIKKYS